MLRFQFETVTAHEDGRLVRLKRSSFIDRLRTWYLCIGRRNARCDYAQSDTFDAVTHLNKGRRKNNRDSAIPRTDDILNDQTLPAFIDHLKISLPKWKSRTLQEEMAALKKREH